MPNDTTIPSSPATLPEPRPRVTADRLESALGDQVSLWTDWDHNGGTFPAEYLPEVIAALQAVEAKMNGAQA